MTVLRCLFWEIKLKPKLRERYAPKYAQSYYSSLELKAHGNGPEKRLGRYVQRVDLDPADAEALAEEEKRREEYQAEREAIRWLGLTREQRIAELSFEEYANDDVNLANPCRREYIRKNYQALEIRRLANGNRTN